MYLYIHSLPGLGKAKQFYAPHKLIKIVAFLLMICGFQSVAKGQSLIQKWDKRFGSNNSETLIASVQTMDGGFLLAGYSSSGIGGDKTQGNRGGVDVDGYQTSDYWVVKIDSVGNKLWDKTFGGDDWDRLSSIIETSDGSILLAGTSSSGLGGDKTQGNRGGDVGGYQTSDYWIVKIDSVGTKLWDKRFGGSGYDIFSSAIKTSDSGFLLAGWSQSGKGGDKSEEKVGYWVVKIDSVGNKLWDKTFAAGALFSAIETIDGGYLLGGTSFSGIGGDKTEEGRGRGDYWIIKIDSVGTKLWDKTFGGNEDDNLSLIIQTSDGNYLLGGTSSSEVSGEKTEVSRGGSDYWIVKIDSVGTKLWDKTFGGNQGDNLSSLIEFTDGGYVLAGYSVSEVSGEKTEVSRGGSDYWIVKIDSVGTKLWDKTFGGNQGDNLSSLIKTSNEGFLLAGTSSSGLGGDKTQESQGESDYWIVKIAPDIFLPPALQINFQDRYSKTPAGWLKDYGLPFAAKAFADTTYSFGWKQSSDGEPVDLSVGGPFPGNGRRRPAPSDVLLATLLHMQGNHVTNFRGTPVEAYWELAVENGDYQVTVSVGDGTKYTGTDLESHSINVEGIAAISHFIPLGTSGNMTRFKQAVVKVTVSDGYLTIDANGGTNTKINYTIIQPLDSITTTVANFTLINAVSGKDIQSLKEGDVLNLATLPDKLTILANTEPGKVGSVVFGLNKQTTYRVENSVPYTLAGNSLEAEGKFLYAFGSQGTGNGQLNNPAGVAFDRSGNLIVMDQYNHRVQKFDAQGNFLLAFGSQGNGDGQFYYPHGVFVDESGNIYVADHSNHRIQKFDSSGNFLFTFGSHGSEDGQFNLPHGVVIDGSGNIYVADAGNNRIQKFNAQGQFLLKFGCIRYGDEVGCSAGGDGQLNFPTDMVLDSQGNILVADYRNHRIQKFDPEGKFLLKFGSKGTGAGHFNLPSHVTIDGMGNIYVADGLNHRIQKFDATGQYISQFGSQGSENGQFQASSGLAIDKAGNIFVADNGNHRIEIFSTGHYVPYNFQVGNYILTATPYSHANGQGIKGQKLTVNFQVVDIQSTARIASGEEAPSLQVTAYPNPFVEQVSLAIQSSISQQVAVSCYNAKGWAVGKLYQFQLEAGKSHLLELNSRSWQDGLYFLQIRTEQERLVKKVILQRK